jgi:hypothetical protein
MLMLHAERLKVHIWIHQADTQIFYIDGGLQAKTKLHLAYHSHEHYSSVRNIDGSNDGPANVTIKEVPLPVHSSATDESVMKMVMQSTGCENKNRVMELLQSHSVDDCIEILVQEQWEDVADDIVEVG